MEPTKNGNGQLILNPQKEKSWETSNLIESTSDEELEQILYAGRTRKEDVLKRMGIFPLPRLPGNLIGSLPKPGPVYVKRIPVSLILKDGSTISRALLVEAEEIKEHPWLLAHFVRIEHVQTIIESPYTMPYRIRKELWLETSMSSLEFMIRMKDGTAFACWYTGYNDFIELPAPYDPEEIVDVKVGRGIAQKAKAVIIEPDFLVCPHYRPEEEVKKRSILPWRRR